jgi:hypothetical protein
MEIKFYLNSKIRLVFLTTRLNCHVVLITIFQGMQSCVYLTVIRHAYELYLQQLSYILLETPLIKIKITIVVTESKLDNDA